MSLAPYAVQAGTSRGRLHPEPESPTRSPFQRDRDRVIHSTAFRRLQYKTQVFVNHEGDFYRTRLTHSIEVAQIARSIARALRLDEDLTEALALAHDLGHPPFGHAGEEALNLAMKPFGGFDHNAQSLRVVTLLESRYAAFDGLNLTWETLEGLVKHNGPLSRPPAYIADYSARHPLELTTYASAEAQVASLADDIAYHSHDLDDGMRARLFGPDDIFHLPVVGEALQAARLASLDVPPPRLRHETIRRVINVLVNDVIAESARRLGKLAPAGAEAVRRAKAPVIAFSPPLAGEPHDHQGAPADRGAVSPVARRPLAAARRLARPRRRGRDRQSSRRGRRLHRRHDRPLRGRRAPAADRHRGVGVSVFFPLSRPLRERGCFYRSRHFAGRHTP
jgi:dGTPase